MPQGIDAYLKDNVPYLLLASVGFLVLAALVLGFVFRRMKRGESQLELARRVLKLVQPEAGLENNLNLFLETIGQIVEADGYAFYIRDSQSGQYVLKAVRHRRSDNGQVEPSYSGLSSYRKEVYLPPLSLKSDVAREGTGIVREGEVPLLHFALDGAKGLVRIGPLARIPRNARAPLALLTDILPRVLDVLIESDRLHLKADVVETSSNALQAISQMAMEPEAVVRKTFTMSASALGMSGGCLLISDAGSVEMPVFFGWPSSTKKNLADSANLSMLIQLIGSREQALWRDDTEPFRQAMSLLGHSGDSLLIAGRLPLPGKNAWFIGGFPRLSGGDLTEEQLSTTIRIMTAQLSQLTAMQQQMKPFGQSYAEFLKLLANTIDDLNPYTVGYSEQMSRYSIVVAKEMGLPDEQIRQIGLAAYLSNIGVLGLSEELYLKEGKFTEAEFEKMKLHTEVGASIVEMTIGSKEVADYIRYHHERMDGNGYPAGLSGEQIPLGARIIAVVQTFLAKIGGRKYREPLPFGQAVHLIESMAGSQLDENVVRTFISWFDAKRKGPQLGGRALGACYDMCCTPSDICQTCPAYNRPEQNCWEVEGNNCQAHGKTCRSCFVYTETKSRSGTA